MAHLREHRFIWSCARLQTCRLFPSIGELAGHPIDRLYRAGVPLSINTDSRMLTPTTLTREYEEVRRVFGWGMEEFRRTNLMAVEAAFVDEGVKAKLRKRLAEQDEPQWKS